MNGNPLHLINDAVGRVVLDLDAARREIEELRESIARDIEAMPVAPTLNGTDVVWRDDAARIARGHRP